MKIDVYKETCVADSISESTLSWRKSVIKINILFPGSMVDVSRHLLEFLTQGIFIYICNSNFSLYRVGHKKRHDFFFFYNWRALYSLVKPLPIPKEEVICYPTVYYKPCLIEGRIPGGSKKERNERFSIVTGPRVKNLEK